MLLKKLGFSLPFSLTSREKDVLKLIAEGYPASYLADQLNLSTRTIENYVATIKCKLYCYSKVELIQKAQELIITGYLDE